MARQISSEATEAFVNGVEFGKSNTSVIVEGKIVKLYLFGNLIAKRDSKRVWVSNAGYETNTTKERLNSIINHYCNSYTSGIYTRKGVIYIEVNENVQEMKSKMYKIK